jgi:membrane-bound serine protease (ClpP class)
LLKVTLTVPFVMSVGFLFLFAGALTEEIILLGVGLVLLGIEIFVVPGFGIFGLLGIGGILAAIYLSMIGQVATTVDYTRAAGVLSLAMMMTIVSAWALAKVLPKSSRFMQTGILLGESTRRDIGYISVDVRSDLVGLEGIAVTDLRPAGTAEFGDERVDVVSEAGWVPAGSTVRIVRSEGYRHVVRPKAQS